MKISVFALLFFCQTSAALAQEAMDPMMDHSTMDHSTMDHAMMRHTGNGSLMGCPEDQAWDVEVAMCMPLAKENGEPVSMAMVHGNIFVVGMEGESPRMRTAIASPNMIMGDIGKSLGKSQYINLDFMGTLENVTYPQTGYPELMQVGEVDSIGRPYVDAQHPHSTPIMGLTLSDTIRLSIQDDYLKIFAAPRGQSTDGPIAFMHRPTGMVNPDVPLGHHIGQDSGHLSSSVVGASLKLSWFRLEASAFYGQEPSPTQVDLPTAMPNSYAVRGGLEFNKNHLFLASFASVKNPEISEPDPTIVSRYSASLMDTFELSPTWSFTNQLIFGTIYNYDQTVSLSSWDEEFLFKGVSPRIWGRLEYLQRTPAELEIPGGIVDFFNPRWVGEATLGYTHVIKTIAGFDCGLGASGTIDFIPGEFINAYGSLPLTGKIFLQVSGMDMWNL